LTQLRYLYILQTLQLQTRTNGDVERPIIEWRTRGRRVNDSVADENRTEVTA